MKGFKKTLRLLGLIILIVLASIGVGITGGAPRPPARKRDNTIEINTELAEVEADESKTVLFEVK